MVLQGTLDHHADVDATVYEFVAFEQGGEVIRKRECEWSWGVGVVWV